MTHHHVGEVTIEKVKLTNQMIFPPLYQPGCSHANRQQQSSALTLQVSARGPLGELRVGHDVRAWTIALVRRGTSVDKGPARLHWDDIEHVGGGEAT